MKKFYYGFGGVLMFFLFVQTAVAASLYIDPPFSELFRGDAVNLAIRLDVDEATEECVNAVDAVITYPDNIEPVDISIGASILNVWVEEPIINTANRTITFAGGIPNGYCGRVEGDPRLTNTLAEIIFRSPGFTIGAQSDSNEATISFTDETAVYLNNGLGTQANLRTLPAQITLNKNAGSMIIDPWMERVNFDEEPPEDFSIELQKDRLAFGGRYFIVFSTTDKQTGIDQYQVIEEPLSELSSFNWGRADAPWITTRSPYVLKDQSLNSVVRVKAIDKAGNEYIATLVLDDSMRDISMTQYIMIIGSAVIGLLSLGIIITVIRALRKRKKNSLELDEDDLDIIPEESENNYTKD